MARGSAVRAVVAVAMMAAAAPSAGQQIPLNRTGSGARAAGMADAFIAVADDGTAASWNPAGLARLRHPELSLVYTSITRHQHYEGFRGPDGVPYDLASTGGYTTASPDFASAAAPFTVGGKPLTVQVDWRRLYQLTGEVGIEAVRLDPASPSRSRTVLEGAGNLDVISAAAAVRVLPRTSLGVSVGWWRGDWRQSALVVEDRPPGSSFFSVREQFSVRGVNVTTGILLSYPRWNVGLVYHAGFDSDTRHQAQVQSNLFPPPPDLVEPDLRMHIPRSAAAGVAFRPTAGWTIAVDATHDQWRRFEVSGGTLSEPHNIFDQQPRSRTSTRDTVSWNAGAEKLFVRKGAVIPLRFGFAWEPQGPRDTVTLEGNDARVVALGGGWNTNRVKLDVAVQHRSSSLRLTEPLDIAAATGAAPPVEGRARYPEWRVKASIIWRITEAGAARRILGRIFNE